MSEAIFRLEITCMGCNEVIAFDYTPRSIGKMKHILKSKKWGFYGEEGNLCYECAARKGFTTTK